MGYFIDNMMDADKIKYKERSICAINGIRQLMSDIQLILSCNTIKGKYYQIAQYIGLATENEKSYYNYFIPINSDIVFLLRFSDHNNTNPSLYNQHERNGRPNKRFIIPFVGNAFQNSGPTPFLGAEHHVVYYPVNALDDEASIKLFLSDLQQLFTNGETNFTQLPQQPIQENNNKQINTNKNMKINESQLRKIIKESIKNVLKEGQQRTPIFTLNAIDLTTDEGIDDMQYTTKTYYSEDEAIEAAKEMANKYSDWDGVINIFIMAGEYELPSGEVYGEPDAIYTVSNKDEETTRSAREKSGYTRHDVDGYPNLNESQLRKIIKESVKKVLKENEIDTPKRWWTVWVTVQSPGDYDHCSRVMYITKASTKEIAEDWAEELCYRKYHGCGAEHYYAHATPSTSEDFARYKKGDRFESD